MDCLHCSDSPSLPLFSLPLPSFLCHLSSVLCPLSSLFSPLSFHLSFSPLSFLFSLSSCWPLVNVRLLPLRSSHPPLYLANLYPIHHGHSVTFCVPPSCRVTLAIPWLILLYCPTPIHIFLAHNGKQRGNCARYSQLGCPGFYCHRCLESISESFGQAKTEQQ